MDTDSPHYFDNDMIDEAINYCINDLISGKKVLIHCNQGESRAPSIALLVLGRIGFYIQPFEEAAKDFKNRYPLYNSKSGIYEHIKLRW